MKFSSVVGFEQSIVDLNSQKIRILTNNLTHRQFSKSREICEYQPGENNSTNYTLSSTITPARGLGFLVGPLINVVKNNFGKGTKVLEDIMYSKLGAPRFESAQSFVAK